MYLRIEWKGLSWPILVHPVNFFNKLNTFSDNIQKCLKCKYSNIERWWQQMSWNLWGHNIHIIEEYIFYQSENIRTDIWILWGQNTRKFSKKTFFPKQKGMNNYMDPLWGQNTPQVIDQHALEGSSLVVASCAALLCRGGSEGGILSWGRGIS